MLRQTINRFANRNFLTFFDARDRYGTFDTRKNCWFSEGFAKSE